MLYQKGGMIMKLIVVPNKTEEIVNILKKDIEGIIVGVTSLSIYKVTLSLPEIEKLVKTTTKKIIVAMNKMLHNEDIPIVEETLKALDKINCSKILFYDLAVLNIAKRLQLKLELIYSPEHLNTSVASNNFYYTQGIHNVLISSDITYQEILEIKKKTKMQVYYTIYGCLPIFYSRRKLISNYFTYINIQKKGNNYYITNNNLKYLIKESDYGTIIYSPCISLLNEIDKLKDIDYYIIDLSFETNIRIIDYFISQKRSDENLYTGFFDKETIYKLKEVKESEKLQ